MEQLPAGAMGLIVGFVFLGLSLLSLVVAVLDYCDKRRSQRIRQDMRAFELISESVRFRDRFRAQQARPA